MKENDKDYRRLKYCAYCYAWDRKDRIVKGKGYMWSHWFAHKFGENINSYHKKVIEHQRKRLQRVKDQIDEGNYIQN